MKLDSKLKSFKRARIEIIPMIDVIFFLLVFFMVSSLALRKINSVNVNLPKTSTGSTSEPQNLVLTVRKDGALFVNKIPVNDKTLPQQLAISMQNHAQDTVVINADSEVSYGQVFKVMDLARSIGVRKFALASEIENAK